jgi:hypothetical protein
MKGNTAWVCAVNDDNCLSPHSTVLGLGRPQVKCMKRWKATVQPVTTATQNAVAIIISTYNSNAPTTPTPWFCL